MLNGILYVLTWHLCHLQEFLKIDHLKPTHAAFNQAIQQMYINVHFCYAYKFGIVTNGLGIVRDVTFYNKEFLKAHPDIVVEKKSDSPG